MFVVLLKFSANKERAGDLMDGHNQWLGKGFDDSVFLLAGSLKPGLGGAIVAHNVSHTELIDRVSDDPFVKEGVVSAEILEIDPGKCDERLECLCD